MPKIFDDSSGPIGSIVSSLLTEAQFQGLYGTGWILMDGRSCTGSVYATVTGVTTVPDARGMVLRGKNNGRADGNQNPGTTGSDGELSLGTYQSDQFKSHTHSYSYYPPKDDGATAPLQGAYRSQTTTSNYSTGSEGGQETRMRNITVNHFIRIN